MSSSAACSASGGGGDGGGAQGTAKDSSWTRPPGGLAAHFQQQQPGSMAQGGSSVHTQAEAEHSSSNSSRGRGSASSQVGSMAHPSPAAVPAQALPGAPVSANAHAAGMFQPALGSLSDMRTRPRSASSSLWGGLPSPPEQATELSQLPTAMSSSPPPGLDDFL